MSALCRESLCQAGTDACITCNAKHMGGLGGAPCWATAALGIQALGTPALGWGRRWSRAPRRSLAEDCAVARRADSFWMHPGRQSRQHDSLQATRATATATGATPATAWGCQGRRPAPVIIFRSAYAFLEGGGGGGVVPRHATNKSTVMGKVLAGSTSWR